MKLYRWKTAILVAAALAASGCSIFKKGDGPKTPVLGNRIDVLVTDSGIDPLDRRALEQAGIEVVVA